MDVFNNLSNSTESEFVCPKDGYNPMNERIRPSPKETLFNAVIVIGTVYGQG